MKQPLLPASLAQCLSRLAKAESTVAWQHNLLECTTILRETPGALEALVQHLAGTEEPVGDNEDAPSRTMQDLLSHVLDQARRDTEDGKTPGREVLAADALERLDVDSTTRAGLSRVGQAWVRAGLVAPEALHALMDAHLQDPQEHGESSLPALTADLDSHLDTLIQEANGDLYGVYSAIVEMMATASPDARHELVRHIASRPGETPNVLALYWLLDREAGCRYAAADALLEQLRSGGLCGQVVPMLPLVRSWLPNDAARGRIDEVIAATRRQDLQGRNATANGQLQEVLGSPADGAGAQTLAFKGEDVEGRQRTGLVLIKTGFGVRDAYLVPYTSAGEEFELAEQIQGGFELRPIRLESAAALIADAIATGLERDEPPAPGLVELMALSDALDLHPQPLDRNDLLRQIDPEGNLQDLSPQKRGRLINRSRSWEQEFETAGSWFEDDATVERILAATANRPRVRRRELLAYLETRREWWADICLRTALVVADAGPPELAASLAVTGSALAEGRDLKKVPLIDHILDRTLQAGTAADDPGFYSDASDPKGPGVMPEDFGVDDRRMLEEFFERGQGRHIWPAGFCGLHGYFFAIVTHPDVIPPSDWLPPLLGGEQGVTASDRATLERLIPPLMKLYNSLNDLVLTGHTPTLPAGCEPQRDPLANFWPDGPLGRWAYGFGEAVERFGHLHEVIADHFAPDHEMVAEVELMMFFFQGLSNRETLKAVLEEEEPAPSLEQTAAAMAEHLPHNLRRCADLARLLRFPGNDADATGDLAPRAPVRSHKIGRNEPCPCGSGRKYKRCCGSHR